MLITLDGDIYLDFFIPLQAYKSDPLYAIEKLLTMCILPSTISSSLLTPEIFVLEFFVSNHKTCWC